jgi:hypothetical protein
MAVRDRRAASLTTKAPPAHPRHLGGCPVRRLTRPSATVHLTINEDQTLRIKIRLTFEPGQSALGYVGSFLLGGVRSLFLNVTPLRAKKRCTVDGAKR